MLKLRRADNNDEKSILKILKETYLYYTGLALKDFWVAEKEGKIVGTAQLSDYESFCFLGSVAVVPELRQQGIARALLNRVLKDCPKDIYLYTIIPDFFKKFGFKITPPLPDLPSKARYECAGCHSDKCVTMLRPAHAT